MKLNKDNNWFTIVEIVVSISIIAILSTISFISYSSYLSTSRDSIRISDLSIIKSNLKLYKQKKWYFPTPWNNFNILNNWTSVATQWFLDNSIALDTLDSLPSDPYIDKYYIYSTTINRQEFEISATLENYINELSKPFAIIYWNYKTVSVNILPTITLAIESNIDIEIKDWIWSWTNNRNKFIFDKWNHNIPYNFDEPFIPVSDWTVFDDLLSDTKINLWQNSDYRTCEGILEAWKSIWNWEYQVVDNNWNRSNINCNSM